MKHMLHRALLTLALFSLSLLAAAPALAVDVRVEVAPVVSFPLRPLLDGLPIELQRTVDTGPLVLEALSQGALAPSSEVWLVDLSQKTGFGASLSLLFNDWEIRYEFASVSYDRLDVKFVQAPEIASVLSLDVSSEGLGVDISSALDSALFHSIGFGYRFTPYDWVIHPYFPLNFGFAVVQLRNDMKPMFGFNIQIGVGAEWDALANLRVGVALRYSFSAYKLPDSSFANIKSAGIQSAVTNQSLTEAVMETIDMLTLGFHASYLF